MVLSLRSLLWPEFLRRFFSSVPVGMIGFYFLASRLFILLLGALSTQVIEPGKFGHRSEMMDIFDRWDAGWYQGIASTGYHYSETQQSAVVFFPLYPLLVHLGNYVFSDIRISGYLISNVCLFGSCVVLWKLVARDYGSREVAYRAVLFLLLQPVSFFFSTIYTESIFFFLFVLLAYFAAGRRWLAAGICGYFLALSRSVGILAVILLAAEFVLPLLRLSPVHHRRAAALAYLRGNGPSFLASVLLTMAGLGSYSFYLWYKFHAPLAFSTAHIHWGRHFAVPWTFLRYDSVGHIPFYTLWFDNALLLGLVLLALGLFLRIRWSHALIAATFVTLYLSTSTMESMPRLMSAVFPFYITLGLAATRWPRLEPLMFAGSAMLLMLSTILFVNGYWFT